MQSNYLSSYSNNCQNNSETSFNKEYHSADSKSIRTTSDCSALTKVSTDCWSSSDIDTSFEFYEKLNKLYSVDQSLNDSMLNLSISNTVSPFSIEKSPSCQSNANACFFVTNAKTLNFNEDSKLSYIRAGARAPKIQSSLNLNDEQ